MSFIKKVIGLKAIGRIPFCYENNKFSYEKCKAKDAILKSLAAQNGFTLLRTVRDFGFLIDRDESDTNFQIMDSERYHYNLISKYWFEKCEFHAILTIWKLDAYKKNNQPFIIYHQKPQSVEDTQFLTELPLFPGDDGIYDDTGKVKDILIPEFIYGIEN